MQIIKEVEVEFSTCHVPYKFNELRIRWLSWSWKQSNLIVKKELGTASWSMKSGIVLLENVVFQLLRISQVGCKRDFCTLYPRYTIIDVTVPLEAAPLQKCLNASLIAFALVVTFLPGILKFVNRMFKSIVKTFQMFSIKGKASSIRKTYSVNIYRARRDLFSQRIFFIELQHEHTTLC